jgi:hypothetical protein
MILLIEHFIDHQNPIRAVRVLREWLVNLMLMRNGEAERWLDHTGCRERANRYLNGISELARARQVSGATKLASGWKKTAELRNSRHCI